MPEAPHEDMAELGTRSRGARCESAHADGVRLDWGAESRLILLLGLPSILVQGNVFFVWLCAPPGRVIRVARSHTALTSHGTALPPLRRRYNVAWAGRNLSITEMASVSTANLAGNLTALSIQYGFIYALESLTSQAMGAQLHHEVGLLVQRCIICCVVALIPAYVLWAVMEDLLVAIHQPPEVAALAAHFLRVYAPGLPGLVLFEISRRFLGCSLRRILRTPSVSSLTELITLAPTAVPPRSSPCPQLPGHHARLHPDHGARHLGLPPAPPHPPLAPRLWVRLGPDRHGHHRVAARLADPRVHLRPQAARPAHVDRSRAWACALAPRHGAVPAHRAPRRVHDDGVVVRGAAPRSSPPSFPMRSQICPRARARAIDGRYWEFVCATIGALGEAQLASHLIAYAIVPTLVMAPIGISIAVAVRSGQLVGEGRPHHAKAVAGGACAAGVVVIAAYTLAVARSSRRIISAFSNEETSAKVIEMTVDIWPLVCAFLVLDGTYMLQFGVLRALAFQFRASICVFVALWVVGVPVTLFIAFRTSAGLPGIWAALLPIYALLNLLCAVIILRADWGAASTEAKEMAREDDALAAEHPAAERAPAMEACARAGGARPWAEDLPPEEGEGCAAPTRAPL